MKDTGASLHKHREVFATCDCLTIRAPKGWYLVLYSKRNFKGKSYNLDSDWTPQPGDWWNGRIKSIKVLKERRRNNRVREGVTAGAF